ncbi:cytochrome b [Aliagarivorans taiwanensis]|uniref:cytochrome b n=1 Tax=Aliagarivorans taiwanensis TaxID=561966 RepID=UPI0004208D3C|nr:cytochrome b N-terminal domain-containing protein [Aliagarivorans taiwanensis]
MKALISWIDDRIPMTKTWEKHISKYPAPKNFNFWYFFGSLAMLVLVNQLLTGIWLTMHYNPTAEGAFASVEYIMRDVPWGWLLRYMHSTGASAFFVVVYLHMYRGLIYGSYQKPRELLWLFGMLIFLVLMAEAFMGYILPWGQMSYWGAQVIISLFGAIPVIGDDLTLWIRGDYVVSGATLNRFFALHVVALPLVLVMLVFLHIIALHEVGSNNPDGIEIKKNKDANGWPKDGIPFHPYYSVKDIVGVVGFLFFFCFVIFFMPDGGGYFLEKPNFEIANPLKTPEHIAPVWYFTPFYAILRAIPDKLGGVIMMGLSILVLFILPWLDRCKVKSWRYRSMLHRINIAQFIVCFIILGVLGVLPPTEGRTLLAQITTFGYFAFFVLLWFYSKNEATKPLPERLTK